MTPDEINELITSATRERATLVDSVARMNLAINEITSTRDVNLSASLESQGVVYALTMPRAEVITQMTAKRDAAVARIAEIDAMFARVSLATAANP